MEENNIRFLSVLNYAHKLIGDRVGIGECVIDATLGNGHDTLFLARTVGKQGVVFGFDIQDEAIEQTRLRLQREGLLTEHVFLHKAGHERMGAMLPSEWKGKVAAVMFNLGYLPGGDHKVITRPQTTLSALEAARLLLRAGGIITAVVYPGHEGGQEEAAFVEKWASRLQPEQYQTIIYRYGHAHNNPPYLVAICKLK